MFRPELDDTDPAPDPVDFRVDDPLRPPLHDGESTTAYCARLPRRRWSHAAKGLLLEFPRTGLVGVPYEMRDNGAWSIVVVRPDRNGTYPPHGYSLVVGQDEIETAIELSVGSEIHVKDRKVINPDSPFIRLLEKRAAS